MPSYTADLSITVDLNIVAKYHTATNLKVNSLAKQNIAIENYVDAIKVLVIKNNEGEDIHPAFNYWKYAAEVGLSDSMANNLFYLFYVNCVYEWRVYSANLVNNDSSRDVSLVSNTLDEFNLIIHAREELTKIRDLCLLLESHPEETDIKFSYRSGAKKKGKEAREKYKVLGVDIYDKIHVRSILQYTLNTLFKAAQESINEILRNALIGKQPYYNIIQNALESLPVPPPTLRDAIISFRKYLITKGVKFLRDEAMVDIDNDNITIAEAMLIYSAFSLLGLMDTEYIERHVDNTERVRYIRSIPPKHNNIKGKITKIQESRKYGFEDISFDMNNES